MTSDATALLALCVGAVVGALLALAYCRPLPTPRRHYDHGDDGDGDAPRSVARYSYGRRR